MSMSEADLLVEEKELDTWRMARMAEPEKADGPRRRAQAAYEFAWAIIYGWTTWEEVLKEYPSHHVGAKDLDCALAWAAAEIEADLADMDMPEQ